MKFKLLLISFFLLGGCASLPPNYGTPIKGSKIGIVLLIDEQPTYAHVGTTIFSNSESNSNSGTNFKNKIGEKINLILERNGHSPELIEPPSLLLAERESLFSYMSSNINFKEDIKVELRKIAQEKSFDYFLIVYPNSGPAWPNSSAYLSGYGLYTRCFLGSCNAFALDYVGARIFDVKNDSSLKPMDFRFFQQQSLPNMTVPDDINDVTSKQIDEAATVATEKILSLVERMLVTSEFL